MKTLVLASIVALALPLVMAFQVQDPEKTSGKQNSIPVPREGAVERRDFMRTKLLFTQNIFEGLTIREFDLVSRGIRELESVLGAEQWVTIDNDDYQRLVEEFRVALERLKKASESKNIEASAFRFYEMSTRCIDCHQHLQQGGYHF
jgi:hypothetical protein